MMIHLTIQQGTSWEDLTVEMGTYRISVRDTDTTTAEDSVQKVFRLDYFLHRD